MLENKQVENFRTDYFYSWKIRRLFVRLFKECYRYDERIVKDKGTKEVIKEKSDHTFDQDGYIVDEKRFITFDEIKRKYNADGFDDDRLIGIVERINDIIDELTKMLDTKTNTVSQKLWKELWYDTLDGRFPHVHWAYYCANNGIWDGYRREAYYNSNISKTSLNGRDRWIAIEYPKVYKEAWRNSNKIIQKAEEVLKLYGEASENLIPPSTRKKVVFFTGSGVSQESGIPTFRDNDGFWEQYPVDVVATSYGWATNPKFVNGFYNQLREKYFNEDIQVNDAHILIAALERMDYETMKNIIGQDFREHDLDDYDITVITQNVDTLHERSGSGRVIHLHGRLDIICSSHNVDDARYQIQLPVTDDKYGNNIKGYKVNESLCVEDLFPNAPDTIKLKKIRPFIVFFGEPVPKMADAIKFVEEADVFIVIGTSLQVYPAASLLEYAHYDTPVIYIDPKPSGTERNGVKVIQKTAVDGMKELLNNWAEYTNL